MRSLWGKRLRDERAGGRIAFLHSIILITLLLIFLDVQIVFEGIEGKFADEENSELEKDKEDEEQRQP